MSGASRRELLDLIDLLCEGAASPEDCARLERLILSEPRSLTTYLDTLEIHGLLAWDAGLGASPLGELPIETSEEPVHAATAAANALPSKRSWRARIAAIASVAALVLVVAVVFMNRPPVAVGPGTVAQNDIPANPPRPEVNVALPPVPVATRPGETVESGVVTPVMPPVEERLLADYSDAAVVRFINDELSAGWTANSVTPAVRATDSQWVRRLYLDLAGRIPTADEAVAFLSDTGPTRDASLVSNLTADAQFSGHLATVWMNLLVGRSQERDIDRGALYAYLVGQFRDNRPWADTVGDLLAATGTQSDNGAANFLLAHMNSQAVPATAIASRIFLGEQLQCSQCHTHPDVKNWTQERFWELNAFFQQCEIVTRTQVDPRSGKNRHVRELVDKPTGGPTYYETLGGVMKVTFPKFDGQDVGADPQVNRRQELVRLLASGYRPQMARAFVNRMWGQFFGHAFTRQPDDMGPHSPASHPHLLDGLTEAFVASGYDVRRLVQWICLSDAYRLDSTLGDGNRTDVPEEGGTPLFSRMYVKPMTVEQLYDSVLVASGGRKRIGAVLDDDREVFVQQFFTAVETEENSECSTFDGSLPQALAMMNGPEVLEALAADDRSLLGRVLQGQEPEDEKIERLCLATLSRYPTVDEMTTIRQLLRRHVKQQTERDVPARVAVNEGLRDIYWAYLNSSEFSVNY